MNYIFRSLHANRFSHRQSNKAIERGGDKTEQIQWPGLHLWTYQCELPNANEDIISIAKRIYFPAKPSAILTIEI